VSVTGIILVIYELTQILIRHLLELNSTKWLTTQRAGEPKGPRSLCLFTCLGPCSLVLNSCKHQFVTAASFRTASHASCVNAPSDFSASSVRK
jgi:hypothetical protein